MVTTDPPTGLCLLSELGLRESRLLPPGVCRRRGPACRPAAPAPTVEFPLSTPQAATAGAWPPPLSRGLCPAPSQPACVETHVSFPPWSTVRHVLFRAENIGRQAQLPPIRRWSTTELVTLLQSPEPPLLGKEQNEHKGLGIEDLRAACIAGQLCLHSGDSSLRCTVWEETESFCSAELLTSLAAYLRTLTFTFTQREDQSLEALCAVYFIQCSLVRKRRLIEA